jgi:hypothetical protein
MLALTLLCDNNQYAGTPVGGVLLEGQSGGCGGCGGYGRIPPQLYGVRGRRADLERDVVNATIASYHSKNLVLGKACPHFDLDLNSKFQIGGWSFAPLLSASCALENF